MHGQRETLFRPVEDAFQALELYVTSYRFLRENIDLYSASHK